MNFLEFLKNLFTRDIELSRLSLPFNILEFLLKYLLPFFLGVILYKFLQKTILKSFEKSKVDKKRVDTFFKWFRLFFRSFLFILNILLFINLFGAEISNYLIAFGGILTHPIVENISMATILLILPILYLARLGGKFVAKFSKTSIIPYLKINNSANNMAVAIFKNLAIVLILIFGLTVIGFDLTLLYGLFGVIGIGIGFGLQGLVGNLFAGFVLLATKTVKVGDHITVDGTEGDLVEIRFVNSIVSTIGHESIIIPNSKLIENPVHNYSFDDRNIIIKNSVQVSYESNLDDVLNLLKEIGESCPFIVVGQDVNTRVVSFDESGITVSVICWIKNSSKKYAAKSWINLEIWRRFKDRGVEIPYPKLDLKVVKSE